MHARRKGVTVLGPSDLDAFLELVARNPVSNVFVEYRARTTRLEPRWLGGEVWGRWEDGQLVSAIHLGANVVPIETTVEDALLFAARIVDKNVRGTTLVGPQLSVAAMWELLRHTWPAPRDMRWNQPHLVLEGAPKVASDPQVRPTRRSDFEVLYPSCVAMYTEEIGVSPEAGGGREMYRARLTQLMSRGWSFAHIEDGKVLFKAEVSCATPTAAQIQGVYVPPELRGQGLATAGVAAVAEHIRTQIAPHVSLYVNDWNLGARKAYEKVGFVQTDLFSTILM